MISFSPNPTGIPISEAREKKERREADETIVFYSVTGRVVK